MPPAAARRLLENAAACVRAGGTDRVSVQLTMPGAGNEHRLVDLVVRVNCGIRVIRAVQVSEEGGFLNVLAQEFNELRGLRPVEPPIAVGIGHVKQLVDQVHECGVLVIVGGVQHRPLVDVPVIVIIELGEQLRHHACVLASLLLLLVSGKVRHAVLLVGIGGEIVVVADFVSRVAELPRVNVGSACGAGKRALRDVLVQKNHEVLGLRPVQVAVSTGVRPCKELLHKSYEAGVRLQQSRTQELLPVDPAVLVFVQGAEDVGQGVHAGVGHGVEVGHFGGGEARGVGGGEQGQRKCRG
mmetsp:Transcript_98930/g.277085  ORF Transcript_98930/g.277085 Transcript_98930/m.277085 type:complete len:298 (-) Transcript_98930:85-978(-)